MLIGKWVNDYLMSSCYGSIVTVSLISDGYICWELCLCSAPFSQGKFPQSSNSEQAQSDTCARCPAHVEMLKFTSKINRTVWGISVVRTFAEHFSHTSLQGRFEHSVFSSFPPSLLPLLPYYSHNTSVTCDAVSNNPGVIDCQCLHCIVNWLITLILEITATQTPL